MTLTPEMMKHISDKTDTREQTIAKAYALGINDGYDLSRHTRDWEDDKALKSAHKTIEEQNKFMAQLTKLVYEHKFQDARTLCLDYGWCISCYTYTCYGDCG